MVDDDARHYLDFTGCGNSLDLTKPRALQMVMDSLRYWVVDMHVDGFRFDLATTLARGESGFDGSSPFLTVVRQDPILSRVKLIAEPWDLGEGGYQVGNFPIEWSEWNDQYRDAMRAYWKGDGGVIGNFARRLTGSSDLYGHADRGPRASINFVTAHDGFTLHDLVSYNDKHNEANGEDNRDGTDRNLSWNCGVEGPSDDEAIARLRETQKRNLLASLLLSQGVPMLQAGDETGRTQQGNNNAYCQDNDISWVHWDFDERRKNLLSFVQSLTALRREQPLFRWARCYVLPPKPRPAPPPQTRTSSGCGPTGWRDDFRRNGTTNSPDASASSSPRRIREKSEGGTPESRKKLFLLIVQCAP